MQPGRALRPLLALALTAACAATPSYARPAGTFQQGFAEAAPVIRSVYVELNALRRDAWFTRLACDPQAELVEVDAEGRRTPLNHDAFSAESIEARVDAVELLGRYADRLAALAAGDAASDTRLSEVATALGARLTGLGARFAELSDATAESYAGPVGEVAAAVTRAVQGRRRTAATRTAILEAAAPVRRILDLLEADLVEVTATARTAALDTVIARCAAHYNARRGAWTDGERREALGTLRALVARRAAMRAQDPAALVRAMRDAHEALVRYARAEARDGAELENALRGFTRRVAVAAEATRALRED